MSNFEYIVSSEEWVLVYDSSVTGDFSGYAQVVNGAELSVYIGASIPAGSIFGAIVGGSPRHLAINSVYGDKLYARRRGNTAMLSLLTMPWLIVGGASPDHSEPTENPVGVSGIDGSGRKRSLLTDSIGQMMTTEQDSEVFTASASSASVLFTVDMTNWRSVLLQVTNAGSGCTISYECSNNQVTWSPCSGCVVNVGTSSVTSITTSNGLVQHIFPKRGKYFRARVSIYGSGTASAEYSLTAQDAPVSVAAQVWGQTAEGSTAAGSPVTIGVEARTTTKTVVSSGQVVRSIGTTDGRMVVRPHSIPEYEGFYAAPSGGLLNSTTALTIKGATANLRTFITSIQLQSEVLTNATEFVIRDGAGGTVLWRVKIPTTGLDLKQIDFEDPLKSSVNTLIEYATLTASGTGAVYLNAQWYQAP